MLQHPDSLQAASKRMPQGNGVCLHPACPTADAGVSKLSAATTSPSENQRESEAQGAAWTRIERRPNIAFWASDLSAVVNGWSWLELAGWRRRNDAPAPSDRHPGQPGTGQVLATPPRGILGPRGLGSETRNPAPSAEERAGRIHPPELDAAERQGRRDLSAAAMFSGDGACCS